MTKDAIIKTAKEAGRIALFGALMALLGYATQLVNGHDPSTTFYIVGTIVLKLADKFIHSNENINANGIAPF